MRTKYILSGVVLLALMSIQSQCSRKKNTDPGGGGGGSGGGVASWLTKGDQSALLAKQTNTSFGSSSASTPIITVDDATTYQTIDGFGFTLTGGSAYVINTLSSSDRTALLQELFGNGDNDISISYLRISIAASDLSKSVFSYDDMPSGQTDMNLDNFNFGQDSVDLIPVLKQILAINPGIKILATPWSPPVWMKDNGSSIGGSLQTQYYDVYAKYFVKYVQQMKAKGITITAITPQNEPLNPANNPSMSMTATQQATFIKNNLGPAFAAANITTKIITYDHNCDNPTYPITILSDAAAKAFVDGSAFHLYAGDISALSTVHNAYPDKNVYFTEQYTASNGSFGGDLKWHLKNVLIGTMRNWGKVALEWNLANDGSFGPHTTGGCTTCLGAITINPVVNRNVGYYIIAHASKFIPPGSIRIESNNSGNLNTVACKTPAGKIVLIAENDDTAIFNFRIKYNDKFVDASLPPGAVATYIW